jgi:hypothetical protein
MENGKWKMENYKRIILRGFRPGHFNSIGLPINRLPISNFPLSILD